MSQNQNNIKKSEFQQAEILRKKNEKKIKPIKKTILLLVFTIISSCTSKVQDEKWINKENLCDSIKIENVNGNDYLFHFSELNLPAKKENNLFKIYKDNSEMVGIISKDTILNINGIEYFKEEKDNIGELNKDWIYQNCTGDESVILSYDKEENYLTLSFGPIAAYMKFKKISDLEYELYCDSFDGNIGAASYCEYARQNFSKTKKIGTIHFISNNVLKINWVGYYDNKTMKTENVIPEFKNSTEFYFMSS